MSVCPCVFKEKWLRLQQKQWQMENKFVTIAHLQKIPELCSLIKAVTTIQTARKKAARTACTCIHFAISFTHLLRCCRRRRRAPLLI